MATESFFSQASLAYIASGGAGKDGKAYSIKPTDGSGDFTFSRGSNLSATRVGPTGLIEKGRENLLTYSNAFSSWSNSGTTEASGFEGYDGTNDAWEIEKQSASAYSSINKTLTATSGVVTISAYVKKGTLPVTSLYAGGGTNPYILFSFDSATITAQRPGLIDTNVEDKGNGWYRISFTTTESITQVTLHPDWSGTNTGTIYAQDVQVEQGLAATDYIESGATTGKAGLLEDEPRLDYSGGATCPSLLLEPSRTNLITYSEYFGGYANSNSTDEPNVTTSPEGLTNATSFLEAATTGQHKLATSYGFDGSSTYTFSVFAKSNGRDLYIDTQNSNEWGARAWFDLTAGTANAVLGTADIEDFGNGWYRCIATGASTLAGGNQIELLTSDGSTNSTTGDITKGVYIYGAQLEEGSYPTSYIPTYGVSQTRNGGMFSNTSLNLQDAGILGSTWTFLYDNTYVDVVRDGGANLFQIRGLASGEYVRISLNSTGTYRLQDSDGTIANSGGNKILGRYDGTKVEFFVDGASVGLRTSVPGRYSDLDKFEPSETTNKIVKLNQILFFPTALSDAECIELTINGIKEDLIAGYTKRANFVEEGASDRLDTYLQSLEDFRVV